MEYLLRIHPKAQKDLDRAPKDVFPGLDHAILELQKNPRPYGVKKLEGSIHRIRVRDWRMIYSIFDQAHLIVVLRIVCRSEKTYRRIR